MKNQMERRRLLVEDLAWIFNNIDLNAQETIKNLKEKIDISKQNSEYFEDCFWREKKCRFKEAEQYQEQMRKMKAEFEEYQRGICDIQDHCDELGLDTAGLPSTTS